VPRTGDLPSAQVPRRQGLGAGQRRIGGGHPIANLAVLAHNAAGYDGDIDWDVSMPDGTPRKLVDVSRLTRMRWRPKICLGGGIAAAYRWFLDHPEARRG
jgi:GDP-L-fucose synthase